MLPSLLRNVTCLPGPLRQSHSYYSLMGVEDPNPTEIFDSLTNPTRVDILQALASAHTESPTDPWVEYSELQDRVGIRDNGNFNYHLRELDGFIEKGTAGYTLTRAGLDIMAAVQSGRFEDDWTWGPVDAPGACLFCEESVELRYEDGVLWLTCGTDDHAMGLSASPALLVSQPDGAVIDTIAFLGNQWGATTRRGICSDCQGCVEGQIEYGGHQPDHYHYHATCHHCGAQHALPLGLYLVSHPVVWQFYERHGVDIRTTPFWTMDFAAAGAATILSEEPLRLRMEIIHEGNTLRLDITRSGSIAPQNDS